MSALLPSRNGASKLEPYETEIFELRLQHSLPVICAYLESNYGISITRQGLSRFVRCKLKKNESAQVSAPPKNLSGGEVNTPESGGEVNTPEQKQIASVVSSPSLNVEVTDEIPVPDCNNVWTNKKVKLK